MNPKRLTCATLIAALLTCACEDEGSYAQSVADESSLGSAQQSLISPDQDLKDFPPWIWPYIHPTDVLANILHGAKVERELALRLVTDSVEKLCECSAYGKPSFENVIELVNIFDMQYGTLRVAQIQAAASRRRSMGMIDGEDIPYCGNGPHPWPSPWPWFDLIRRRAQVFEAVLPKLYELSAEQTKVLHTQIAAQVARFEKLAK